MDADLQDPPELLIEMYYLIKTGEWDMLAAAEWTAMVKAS